MESDLLMLDTYRPGIHMVRCPLFAFAGTRDTAVAPADVSAWQDTAAGPFELRLLDAGHFFVFSHGGRAPRSRPARLGGGEVVEVEDRAKDRFDWRVVEQVADQVVLVVRAPSPGSRAGRCGFGPSGTTSAWRLLSVMRRSLGELCTER
ncbi:hypothetical protein ACODT5_11130 [Streptomyces sp. 5.8]|uniref:hypothetical protein n=1 Tax=Streptomyces sp. 5.8 TaxID=3406571 RepID=UPI003BB814F3